MDVARFEDLQTEFRLLLAIWLARLMASKIAYHLYIQLQSVIGIFGYCKLQSSKTKRVAAIIDSV
jgi:hypothetical protein